MVSALAALGTSAPRFLQEDAVLRFEGVTLAYPDAAPVLREVDLSLPAGGFHVLTGASGAGKSSLLKLMYLALKPTQGRVWLFGKDTARLSRKDRVALRRRIGVVFQEFRLLDHLSVYHNVSLPLRVQGKPERVWKEDVLELLTWVGLEHRIGARPLTLSGGEKQRVAIARAVVAQPALLLADEPTGSVDPEMGLRLMRLFAELNRRRQTTVFLATHDVAAAAKLGVPVLRLAEGQVMREVQ
jgi:cell division transport system ATP-binding protein